MRVRSPTLIEISREGRVTSKTLKWIARCKLDTHNLPQGNLNCLAAYLEKYNAKIVTMWEARAQCIEFESNEDLLVFVIANSEFLTNDL